MATSAGTDTGRNDRRTPFGSLGGGSLSRYDLTLLVIPLVLTLSGIVGAALPVPTRGALVAAALCAAVVVADALFLNPPTAR